MTSTNTTDATMTTQLRAAADECEELEELLNIARDRRNEIIGAAHDDEGMSYGDIARYARLSRARVIAIMATI